MLDSGTVRSSGDMAVVSHALPRSWPVAAGALQVCDDLPETALGRVEPDVCVMRWAVSPSSVGGARRLVTEAARRWGLPGGRIEDIALVTSELVTNAITYAEHGTGVVCALRHWPRDAVIITVQDQGDQLPRPRPASEPVEPESVGIDLGGVLTERGRGLEIVARLTDRWGWYPLPRGKVVWAQINS